MGKKKEKLESKANLENKIRLVGALHLIKEKNMNVGSSDSKYFARLYLGVISNSERIPEGVKVNNFPDYIEVEIPKKTYDSLSRNYTYNPYGSITIKLGVEDPHPSDILEKED